MPAEYYIYTHTHRLTLELPEAYGIAIQPDNVGEEATTQKEVPQTKGRRGRKRKRGSAGKKHGKARASISEMQSWFTKSNSGEYAFCHLCGCDIKIVHGQTNLLEHVQSEKHARQSRHLGQNERTEEHRQGRYLDDNNLEEIPRFKPWLRLNKITGNPYCLYCRYEILRCKSQEDLEKHRASRRHLTSEKMTRLERKGLGGHLNYFQLNDNEIANEGGTLDSDNENLTGNNPQETELLEELRQERDAPEEIDEVGERIPLFLSTENISKQVKETEAQVVSFIVENRVPWV
ncbi:hypothetical protein BSL78_22751 [Apostichopus japonicus]|uniref:Uncharacterized protein n=1 Tax=Stichopus japonicus TaxID=307972 RepID=A0A2G8JXD0_STIJA|nr:hypothetical protein BSL78_22751 [Apostichopus japonicus]